MAKTEETTHLGIRIPPALKAEVEKLAAAGHRRFSDEVRMALENHVKAAKVKK